jgi:hypothetical protein
MGLLTEEHNKSSKDVCCSPPWNKSNINKRYRLVQKISEHGVARGDPI